MTAFSFATAGRISFGAGASAELPRAVREFGGRAFVCTGSDPARHERLLAALGDPPLARITREPTLDDIRAALGAAREHDPSVVVGLGGGAVLDAAKVVAALLGNPGDPLDYAEVIGAGRPLAAASAPCVAVPTTAGTGSEVTANGVVSSPEHAVKVSLRSPTMLPRVALVDPVLTLGCPPAVTAQAGLDALVQCIEAFVSPFATPLVDGFCVEGIRRAGSGLRRAWADGSDLDARTDVSLCALLSGLALANGKLGAAHGLAGPLGGLLAAPHGALTAAVMVEVSRANLAALAPGDPALDRYALVGELLTGTRSAEAFLSWFARTADDLGIVGLSELGLRDDQVDAVALAASNASSTRGNPVTLPLEVLSDILRAS